MFWRFAKLLIIALGTFCLVVCSPSLCKEKSESGVCLIQVGKVCGDAVFTATGKGVRIDLKKSGLTLVAKAPAWKVFEYSKERRIFYPTTLMTAGQNLVRGEAAASGHLFNLLTFVRSKNVSVLGKDAVQYTTPKSVAEKAYAVKQAGGSDNGAPQKATYTLYEAPAVPEQACVLLKTIYGLPTSPKGLPLEFSYVTLRGVHEGRLVTYGIHSCAAKASDFECPPGFKLAKSEQEVTVSRTEAKEFGEMIEGFHKLKD